MESKIQKYAEKWCKENNGRILKLVSEIDDLKARLAESEKLVGELSGHLDTIDIQYVPNHSKHTLLKQKAKQITEK